MTGWIVQSVIGWLNNGRRVFEDKVFYVSSYAADEVRRSLITHDLYPPDIIVTKED